MRLLLLGSNTFKRSQPRVLTEEQEGLFFDFKASLCFGTISPSDEYGLPLDVYGASISVPSGLQSLVDGVLQDRYDRWAVDLQDATLDQRIQVDAWFASLQKYEAMFDWKDSVFAMRNLGEIMIPANVIDFQGAFAAIKRRSCELIALTGLNFAVTLEDLVTQVRSIKKKNQG